MRVLLLLMLILSVLSEVICDANLFASPISVLKNDDDGLHHHHHLHHECQQIEETLAALACDSQHSALDEKQCCCHCVGHFWVTLGSRNLLPPAWHRLVIMPRDVYLLVKDLIDLPFRPPDLVRHVLPGCGF